MSIYISFGYNVVLQNILSGQCLQCTLYLFRIDIGVWKDVRNVRRLRYVLVITQYVYGVFTGRHWIVFDVSRTVAVVVTVDFRFRGSFDTES